MSPPHPWEGVWLSLSAPATRDQAQLSQGHWHSHSLPAGAGSSAGLPRLTGSLANTTPLLSKTSAAVTLLSVPLRSINSSKVVPRFERFGLGVLEPSNPKM